MALCAEHQCPESMCDEFRHGGYVEHKPALRPATPTELREPLTPGFIPTPNLAPENWLDISNETSRTYVFAGQEQIVIHRPVRLHITRKENGDSHRVVDAQGQMWYIRAGWFAIMFATRDGKQSF